MSRAGRSNHCKKSWLTTGLDAIDSAINILIGRPANWTTVAIVLRARAPLRLARRAQFRYGLSGLGDKSRNLETWVFAGWMLTVFSLILIAWLSLVD